MRINRSSYSLQNKTRTFSWPSEVLLKILFRKLTRKVEPFHCSNQHVDLSVFYKSWRKIDRSGSYTISKCIVGLITPNAPLKPKYFSLLSKNNWLSAYQFYWLMLLFLYLSPKCTFSGNSFTSNFTGFFFFFARHSKFVFNSIHFIISIFVSKMCYFRQPFRVKRHSFFPFWGYSFIFSVRGRVTWGKKGVFNKAISLSIDLKATATFCLTTKTLQNLFIFRLASARYFAVTWREMRPVVWHKQRTCFLNATFLRSNIKQETSSLFLGRREKQEFSKACKHKMPSVSTSLWLSVESIRFPP